MSNAETKYVEVECDWDYNPRDPSWVGEQYSTMICFHRRYDIGDIQFDESLKYKFHRDEWLRYGEGTDWTDDLQDFIYKNYDVAVCLPIYLYDHSGLTIRTHPFESRWDSIPIGYIFMTKEKAREAYGVTYVTQKIRKRLVTWLSSDIEEYDRYLRGVDLVTEEEARMNEWREICEQFKWEFREWE